MKKLSKREHDKPKRKARDGNAMHDEAITRMATVLVGRPPDGVSIEKHIKRRRGLRPEDRAVLYKLCQRWLYEYDIQSEWLVGELLACARVYSNYYSPSQESAAVFFLTMMPSSPLSPENAEISPGWD